MLKKLTVGCLRMFIFITRILFAIKCRYIGRNIDYTEPYEVLLSQKSIIRWGDGETKLLLYYGGIPYQKKSIKLSISLIKVLLSTSQNIVLFFPKNIINQKRYFEYKDVILWGPTQCVWNIFYNGDQVSDAMAFRRENKTRGELFEYIFNKREVSIVVSKQASDLLLLPAIPSFHIQIPEKNSFECIDVISQKIKKRLDEIISFDGLSSEKKIVLISMGPATKILIIDLCKLNYCAHFQFIDVGHMFDHGEE